MADLPAELRTSRRSSSLFSLCGATPPDPDDPQGAQLIQDMHAACGTFDYQWTNGGFDADHQAGGPPHGNGYTADLGYGYLTPAGKTPVPALNQAEPVRAPGFVFQGGNAPVAFALLGQAVIDKYDQLYHKAENNPADIAHNRMMRALLLIYASAQERCNYINDIHVHRHDAPQIGAEHLTFCFNGVAPVFVPGGDQAAAGKALGTMILEHLLKGKISLANAYFQLNALAANAQEAQQIMQINLILLHVWSAVRPLDVTAGMNFDPGLAHSYLTAETKKRFLKENGAEFNDKAKTKISALYAGFQNAAYVPPGQGPGNDVRIRFYDAVVDGLGVLQQKHKYFLQSLPRMDNTGVGVGNATPCELKVRERVISRLKQIASRSTVNPAHTGGGPFQHFAGNDDNAQIGALLDQLIEDMNSGKFWIETSSKEPLFNNYYINAPNHAAFRLRNQYENTAAQVNWQHVFPDCGAAPNATVVGTEHVPHKLAYEMDGRQNAKLWYMDWRNDKDQYLYDCFDFTFAERPSFANYSTWPLAPEPNAHYGLNQIVWRRDILQRCVIGIGDKGTPYRSRLLLLQDLLCNVPLATGEDANSSDKASLIQAIFVHLAKNHPILAATLIGLDGLLIAPYVHNPPLPPQGYLGRWNLLDLIGNVDSNQRVILQPKYNRGTALLFECHIFGPLVLEQDAWAITLSKDTINPGMLDGPDPGWIGTIQGYGAAYTVTVYRGDPQGQAPRTPIPAVLTSSDPILRTIRTKP